MDGAVTAVQTLTGTLSPVSSLTGGLSGVPSISGELTETGLSVIGSLTSAEIIYEDIPAYDGSYDVTPLPGAETILETVGKRMTGDVTVGEIPYYETSNPQGGYTVIIG